LSNEECVVTFISGNFAQRKQKNKDGGLSVFFAILCRLSLRERFRPQHQRKMKNL